MLTDHGQFERRNAIVRLLRAGQVRKQHDLVRLLRKEGLTVTQSSVSRDLRDLGVLKASGRYVLTPEELAPARTNFSALTPFVREIRRAGASITVIRTTTGAAQSIAVAIDRAAWPEVVGTLSGDDTIFLATDSARAQTALLERLRSSFNS
jgi:transcriptional regulator of arginine metabolism